MPGYELSCAADQDFENIFEFGIDTFGLDQALSYQNGMKERFDKLAEQPQLYPAVDHIRAGYRRSVYGSHSIYYRIDSQGVVIARILGQQDLTDAFS
jgi:toxin ParE1/3/4